MLIQALTNGVIAGITFALVGLGFSLVLEAARFFLFGHGASFAWGGYFAYTFVSLAGLSPFFGIPLAVLCCALLGCAMMVVTYLPFHRRPSASTAMLIASIGAYVVSQNVVSILFGENLLSLYRGPVSEGVLIAGARVTDIQLVMLVCGIGGFAAVWSVLHLTRIGLIYRAFTNDETLARVLGIRSNFVVLAAYALGSAVAGVAGVLLAYDTGIQPSMGFSALLAAVVAVIIGGRRSIIGILLGGLLVGMAMHLSVLWIAAQWQDALVFIILVAFLLLRPRGFFGRPTSGGAF